MDTIQSLYDDQGSSSKRELTHKEMELLGYIKTISFTKEALSDFEIAFCSSCSAYVCVGTLTKCPHCERDFLVEIDFHDALRKFIQNNQNELGSTFDGREKQDLYLYALLKSFELKQEMKMYSSADKNPKEKIQGIYIGWKRIERQYENYTKHVMYGNAVERGNWAAASFFRSEPDFKSKMIPIYSIIMISNLGIWVFDFEYQRRFFGDRLIKQVAIPLPYEYLVQSFGFTPMMDDDGQVRTMYYRLEALGRNGFFEGFTGHEIGLRFKRQIAKNLDAEDQL